MSALAKPTAEPTPAGLTPRLPSPSAPGPTPMLAAAAGRDLVRGEKARVRSHCVRPACAAAPRTLVVPLCWAQLQGATSERQGQRSGPHGPRKPLCAEPLCGERLSLAGIKGVSARDRGAAAVAERRKCVGARMPPLHQLPPRLGPARWEATYVWRQGQNGHPPCLCGSATGGAARVHSPPPFRASSRSASSGGRAAGGGWLVAQQSVDANPP